LKRELRALLEERRFDDVAALAGTRRRVLAVLVSLTYDADVLIRWRAVEAMGAAAARLVHRAPQTVREELRRLMWLITEESGAICWHAPEAMAEIVARTGDAFADYVPIVAHLLLETAQEDLEHLRPGILWAIGRLGPRVAGAAGDVLPAIVEALGYPDAQVRGLAVWCLGRLGQKDPLVTRDGLRDDEGAVELYADGRMTITSVARLVEAALAGGDPAP
jgi:hypothetical protein